MTTIIDRILDLIV